LLVKELIMTDPRNMPMGVLRLLARDQRDREMERAHRQGANPAILRTVISDRFRCGLTLLLQIIR